MKKEELQGILETISMLDDVKPLVQSAIKSIQAYGPEVREFFGGMQMAIVEMRIDAIKRYESAGFTREEAIYMTMDEWFAYRRLLSNHKTK